MVSENMLDKLHKKGISNIIFVFILLVITTSIRLYLEFDVLNLFYLGVVLYYMNEYLKMKLN